ncbi:relaxase/mobilization nuclease domain-containing protein, partial [Streptococcus suis]|uniref:relaxase/mobilization nuclease domain-containing protein n=1 Tax=Streptococcus suis TaxID=1307 RepID=UPI0012902E52
DRAEKRQDRFEYHLNKQGAYSWKSELKEYVEQALTSSVRSSEDFIANLQALGVQVKHRTRQGEPIYLYEFVGQDGKTHKAKDYKLGGTA